MTLFGTQHTAHTGPSQASESTAEKATLQSLSGGPTADGVEDGVEGNNYQYLAVGLDT